MKQQKNGSRELQLGSGRSKTAKMKKKVNVLLHKGVKDGERLAIMMEPSVEDVLGANDDRGLAHYATKFAEADVADANHATLLSMDDLKGILPDAPHSDILKLRRKFALAASGKLFKTSQKQNPKVFPVLFKLVVKYIIDDEDREGNVLLVSSGQ